jgi:hypothetical protein
MGSDRREAGMGWVAFLRFASHLIIILSTKQEMLPEVQGFGARVIGCVSGQRMDAGIRNRTSEE